MRFNSSVRLFVAITDSDWFRFLSELKPDEVNFWQPSGRTQFRALIPGEPLLFKLHSPDHYIVGGGFFSHYSPLPVSFAWSAFGQKNGAVDEQEMRRRIEKYRRVDPNPVEDYQIGCILLQQPFFLQRPSWVPMPNWGRSIVRGKGYSTDEEVGQRLWAVVSERMGAALQFETMIPSIPSERYGTPQIVLPRLGQGAFRVVVTDSYQRRCAVTRSHILHVLDAAHIKPYSSGGTHQPCNGLLLRQDVHTLFDKGYMTVTPDHRIEVSRRIREEFDNGKEYYALHGTPIYLPQQAYAQPSREMLDWHNKVVYKS